MTPLQGLGAGGGVVGIGTDVVDLRRIAAVWGRRGPAFARRILGPQEMAVFEHRLARSSSRGLAFLGTRFSAKEAFSKAIGLGLHAPMRWRDCQIVNRPTGEPHIVLSGELRNWFEARGWQAWVTVSDEVEMAVSFVIVQSLRS